MKLLHFFGIVVFVTFGFVDARESDVTKFMKLLEIIPDVVSEGATYFLTICYDSGVFADRGVELTPTQVKNEPRVEWKAQKNSFYTLILTDPDAPSRAEPTDREFHHWLVVNIPGNHISKGEVLTEYIGAGPPKYSGLHRYVFLLYKQPQKLQFYEKYISNTSAEGRPNFSAEYFAAKYKLGPPLAANFFQAQYDDYVPILYQQLGII